MTLALVAVAALLASAPEVRAVRHAGSAYAEDVAGALYMPIEVAPRKVAPAELDEEDRKFQRKARGIINGYDAVNGVDKTSWYIGGTFNTPIKNVKVGVAHDYVNLASNEIGGL